MDRKGAAEAIADFLRALGHEPRGELSATPRLVAEAWLGDLLSGQDQDPAAILVQGAVPTEEGDRAGLVVLRDLHVTSTCPHHLMPSHGRALVAYLPGDRVAGFGAIARTLRALTRRLTLQERATNEMARHLCAALGARAAMCRLELVHTCMIARGARESEARIETVALEGAFSSAGPERDLALSVLSREGR